LDPQIAAAWMQRMQSQQSLPGALVGGLLGAVGGAAAWAAITVTTKFQIGFMAIGVGILVGVLVRKMGRGIAPVYGITGAVFSLLGCVAGNLLTTCWFISEHEHTAFTSVLASLTPDAITSILTATFDIMDALFYGIAIYEGYKLSFRQFTHEDLAALR
jgi:uncharacterized membrane protein YsdA (DUF1294 family)